MSSPLKQVIVIRKDLKMRRGKEISQGAHASMGAILGAGEYITREDGSVYFHLELDERMKDWLLGAFTKITVTVNSEEEMLDIYRRAKEAGLLASLITDKGLTEFGGVPTNTAIAIGPDTREKVDQFTGGLGLY
jgi:peptidyl-tRNA hydrolase, PTH2 family